MASGNKHDAATVLLAIACTGLTVKFPEVVPVTLPIGAISGLMLSPDLDLRNCNAKKRWGLFRHIWTPYTKLIPHRSVWSHGVLIGTLGRLSYLLLFVGAIAAILSISGKIPAAILQATPLWLTSNWRLVVGYTLGLAIADLQHRVMDGL